MTMMPAEAGEDALVTFATGLVTMCAGCGRAEGELVCDACGEQLCPDCWAGGNEVFCEGCLLEEGAARPVEDVGTRKGYL